MDGTSLPITAFARPGLLSSTPSRVLAALVALNLILLMGVTWMTHSTNLSVQSLQERNLRIERLRGNIAYWDEVLSMSAHMVVASGDTSWEHRYHVHERKLSVALTEAISLTAEPAQGQGGVRMLEQATDALGDLENRVFAMVRSNRAVEAAALLQSTEYKELKRLHASGMTALTQALAAKIHDAADLAIRQSQNSEIALSVAMVLLLASLTLAPLSIRKWQYEAIQNRETLELRVQERTQDLADANESLRDREIRNQAIMDNVPAAILILDQSGKIETCNRIAESQTGYSATELFSQPYFTLFDTEMKVGELAPVSGCEVMAKRKGGAIYPCEYTIVPFSQTGPEQKHYILLASDVTARKESDRQRNVQLHDAHQSQKLEALETLSGGIAHEINTPIQYIGDNIRFMREAFEDLVKVVHATQELCALGAPEADLGAVRESTQRTLNDADIDFLVGEVPKSLAQTLEGVERISEIVRAIKQFSHPDSKEKVLVDLNEAIDTTLTVSRNQWKYVAEIEINLDPNLPPVPGLPGQINQVLLNLIANAAHAIEDRKGDTPGRIEVATGQDGAWAEVLIADNGVGIAKENYRKIFEPFFTTKEPGRGTGQGMAIAHNIVTKLHGGQLYFVSRLGEGTTFVVRLPLGEAVDLKKAS